MGDFPLELKSCVIFKIRLSWVLDFLHRWIEIILQKELSDHVAKFLLFASFLLSELLNQSVFHDNQIIFERDVSIFTHVLGNDEAFDFIIWGLEILQGDGVKSIKDFQVFLGELCDCFEIFCGMLDKDFVFTVPGEGTGHWHVELLPAPSVGTDDVADGFFELVIGEDGVAPLDRGIRDLTVSDEDDVP